MLFLQHFRFQFSTTVKIIQVIPLIDSNSFNDLSLFDDAAHLYTVWKCVVHCTYQKFESSYMYLDTIVDFHTVKATFLWIKHFSQYVHDTTQFSWIPTTIRQIYFYEIHSYCIAYNVVSI